MDYKDHTDGRRGTGSNIKQGGSMKFHRILVAVDQCVEAVLHGASRATKYISKKLTVKATRIGKVDKREKSDNIRLTIGRPNYAERSFIKDLIVAKEPFPVKKVQLKFKGGQ